MAADALRFSRLRPRAPHCAGVLATVAERGIESTGLRRGAPSTSAKESRMAHYLIQVAYNTSGLGALVKDPQDRIEKVRPAVEALGGSIESGVLRLRRVRHRLDLRDARQHRRGGHGARGRRRWDRFVVQDHGPADIGRGGPGDAHGRKVDLHARTGLRSRNAGTNRPGTRHDRRRHSRRRSDTCSSRALDRRARQSFGRRALCSAVRASPRCQGPDRACITRRRGRLERLDRLANRRGPTPNRRAAFSITAPHAER